MGLRGILRAFSRAGTNLGIVVSRQMERDFKSFAWLCHEKICMGDAQPAWASPTARFPKDRSPRRAEDQRGWTPPSRVLIVQLAAVRGGRLLAARARLWAHHPVRREEEPKIVFFPHGRVCARTQGGRSRVRRVSREAAAS